MDKKIEIAIFGGGCFWCAEAVFSRLKGVRAVTPGYAGGEVKNPTYEQVSGGASGHAEAVKIDYDQSIVNFSDLLAVFFSSHDPTALNRQGNDAGEQYRSVIFCQNAAQADAAARFIKKLTDDAVFPRPIVTQLKPTANFYPAEDYHRRYYENNPKKTYCQVVISPKIKKLKEQFAYLLK